MDISDKHQYIHDMPSSHNDVTLARETVSPLHIGIVLLDEFTLTAFSGFLDALRLASDYGGKSRQILISWVIMSVEGHYRVSSAGTTHSELSDLQPVSTFDYIAVCGGNNYVHPAHSSQLIRWLKDAYDTNVTLVGICSGTFTIAYAGLVRANTVCVHWNVINAFRAQFPEINCKVDRLFIDAGRLITCAGSTAAIDLALHLVTRHCGRDKARQSLRHMMLYSIRPARLPQAHFYIDLDKIADPRVHKAIDYIEQRINDRLSVQKIAAHVGLSGRQLERVFNATLEMTPIAVHRLLKLQYGKWRLINTADSITDIAVSCGFSDNSHFSREFKALFGTTPRNLRKKERSAASSSRLLDPGQIGI